MKIHIKPEDADFGIIYIESNHFYFPFFECDDFYVVMLNGWLDDLDENEKEKVAKFKMFFFDGDYHLSCEKTGDMITVQGIRGSEVWFEETMTYSALKEEVYAAAKQLAEALKNKPSQYPTEIVTLCKKLKAMKHKTGDGSPS